MPRAARSSPASTSPAPIASPGAADASHDLRHATKAPLPESLAPQLATLAASIPSHGDWIVENKFDGYRVMARIARGRVKLITRGGHDWTHRMQKLAASVSALGVRDAWLDGEVVVFNDAGVPDFNALQNAFDTDRPANFRYFVFDAPFLGGLDLRRVPLHTRRALLKALFDGKPAGDVAFSEDFEQPPAQVLDAACRMGMEGIILKQRDAPYTSARSESWLKLKCARRQEFVVIGFTDRAGAHGEVGGMLLAYHEHGQLRYAGSVGTGWDAKTGRALHQQLRAIETSTPAVDTATVKPGRWSRRAAGSEHWVEPRLVAEVGFTEWTPDGHIRHPVFKGLREDKTAAVIMREQAVAPNETAARSASKVRLTHPERVIDPATGRTKLDLVRYYEDVAPWILPHLKDRPVSLVRAPTGIGGELFFQKHPETTKMPGLTVLDPALWPGHGALFVINSLPSLLAAVQMNTIELHTWNSVSRRINEPDRVIFDLDPGEGVTWPQVQESAVLMRAMLVELGLQSWLKTSGGKGLHVVVPLAPKFHYDVVKDFSQTVVVHMAKTIPQRFVPRAGAANRIGRIFIDFLRNGHGQTTAAAFSARARPGMGVSMTVSWDDLPALRSGAQWDIETAPKHLASRGADPWAGYAKAKQPLAGAMKKLGFEPGR